jgi:acetyl esterase/lipase
MFVFVMILSLLSCGNERIPGKPQHIENGLKISELPFSTATDATHFHENIMYGTDQRNVYDFFKPNTKQPSSLLILIHGGGFVTGDKANYYKSFRYRRFINRLLARNIAVAT